MRKKFQFFHPSIRINIQKKKRKRKEKDYSLVKDTQNVRLVTPI